MLPFLTLFLGACTSEIEKDFVADIRTLDTDAASPESSEMNHAVYFSRLEETGFKEKYGADKVATFFQEKFERFLNKPGDKENTCELAYSQFVPDMITDPDTEKLITIFNTADLNSVEHQTSWPLLTWLSVHNVGDLSLMWQKESFSNDGFTMLQVRNAGSHVLANCSTILGAEVSSAQQQLNTDMYSLYPEALKGTRSR